MQKKPGQISANTLGLRFMQNAAKAKYERELEAVKAKVKSEEEWEVSQSVRHGWGIRDGEADEERSVTYEQSYLPFLFPGLSGSRAATVASTSTSKRFNDDSSDREDAPNITMKGRRAFGKYGKEQETQESPSEPSEPSPSISSASSLPRRVKAISSHGRTAVAVSDPSRPAATKLSSVRAKPPVPEAASSTASTMQSTPVFVKPQIDAPRTASGERKKRNPSDMGGSEDAQRKKKKKRKVQDV